MLALLDIEASSLLSPHSYPIEIGWVAADLSAGYVALISPEPDWTDWSAEAELIHGLAPDAIRRLGEPATEVASALNDMLSGAEIATDSPGIDARWLQRLFVAAYIPAVIPLLPCMDGEAAGPHVIQDSDTILVRTAEQSSISAEDLEVIGSAVFHGAGLRRHRALDDALFQAICFQIARWDRQSSERELLGHLTAQIENVKARILGGAVARHARRGGNDADLLRAILAR
ncbi:hypothetical protein [Magnetospirillum sp. SS-4]|uniref:hypothetical protein n=1 Tax=Magnetospirillum sp. SS-4 TaxID=2681465 RepID=UPI0013865C63|nr:hypothetical protein [Magnetospirillum sp. SS-4]CAA7627620.1 hypothetical protein MTBSS4_90145 [Magnetospirillum sp. SS-4]